MVTTLSAAGAAPEHLVTVTVFATDAERYRKDLKRARRGLAPPPRQALSGDGVLRGASGLFDPAALVELIGIAVVPG